MAQLSREEFDSIEFGAARTGDHRDAALQMTELATSRTQTTGLTRAEAHLRAGEQWLFADDPAAAAQSFRRALADGGEEFVDARVALARALFLLGEGSEARTLVERLEADGRGDPRKCDLVAELLFEQSDLIGALDWANTGVELCLAAGGRPAAAAPADAGPHNAGDGPGPGEAADAPGAFVPQQLSAAVDRNELRMLLSLRYRIRNDMGLDEDAYDKLLDEL